MSHCLSIEFTIRNDIERELPTKGGAGAPPAEGDADAAKDATGDAAAKTDAAPAEEKKE